MPDLAYAGGGESEPLRYLVRAKQSAIVLLNSESDITS